MLAGILGTEQVPVDSNFFDDLGADSMLMARFCARVRKRADLPSVSMQDVYQHPTIRSLARPSPATCPPLLPLDPSNTQTACETGFAEVLAGIVGTEHVPVDSHFFDDLGADSMLMARFCARVRKRADLPSVSMQDVYQHPTIRSLASSPRRHTRQPPPLTTRTPRPRTSRPSPRCWPASSAPSTSPPTATSSTTSAPTPCSWPASAHGCASAPDLPTVSMQDVYQHPTIRSLAQPWPRRRHRPR